MWSCYVHPGNFLAFLCSDNIMRAYNAAVERWATKLTINGSLTDDQIWKIECWIWNTSQNTLDLPAMLNDIYIMAYNMSIEIVDRFKLQDIVVEKPIAKDRRVK